MLTLPDGVCQAVALRWHTQLLQHHFQFSHYLVELSWNREMQQVFVCMYTCNNVCGVQYAARRRIGV